MTLTLILAGLLLLLLIPKLGHWIAHIPQHFIIHKGEHSERFLLCLSGFVVLLFVSIPVLLYLRQPLLSLDAFLLLCIFYKLLSCTNH